MCLQQGETPRLIPPRASLLRPTPGTGSFTRRWLWRKEAHGTRPHRRGQESGRSSKIRAVRTPSLSAGARPAPTWMTECDLCQADGVTEDEESVLEDHWISDEMSVSEGESADELQR